MIYAILCLAVCMYVCMYQIVIMNACQVICILCDLSVVCMCIRCAYQIVTIKCLLSDMYMCDLSVVIIIVESLLTQRITVCTPHVCMHKFIN